MDKFYGRCGWVVFAGLLTGVYHAYAAVSFEQAIAVMWMVQIPLVAYITAGIVMLFRASAAAQVFGGCQPAPAATRIAAAARPSHNRVVEFLHT